jgi:hypothetical protein
VRAAGPNLPLVCIEPFKDARPPMPVRGPHCGGGGRRSAIDFGGPLEAPSSFDARSIPLVAVQHSRSTIFLMVPAYWAAPVLERTRSGSENMVGFL